MSKKTPLRAFIVALLAAFVLSAPVSQVDAGPRAKRARAAKVESRPAAQRSLRPKQDAKKTDLGRAARKVGATRKGDAKGDRTPTYRTPAQAAAQIRPGHNVYVPVGHSVAKSVLQALGARANKPSALSGEEPVHIVGLTNVASRRLYDTDKIVARSLFIGSNNRDAIAQGRGDFHPVHLSRIPRLIRDGTIPVDVALIQVSPPDADGMVSLGPTTAATLAAMDKARTVIAEVNPNVPRTHGDARVHQSRIHYMVRADDPLTTIDPVPATKVDQKIAEHVMKLIPERPTLQFGIGATTDAVAGLLADSGRKDLRVHSEMISDGTMRLVESGAVQGKVRYSFALGSKKMLDWMDDNRKLEAKPTDFTNDPIQLAKIENLVSINTALRVDLHGQINAQYVGNRYYSGVGGQQDFFRGAMLSPGGKAIMALPSTSEVGGKEVSRIVLQLGHDDVVTTSMHDVQYVVTEYGVAHLEGKSTRERAEALISVAHPKFRPELRRQLDGQADSRRQAVEAKQRKRQQQRQQ